MMPVSSATSRAAASLERLPGLHVALGQAPLDPARAVAAGDDRDPRACPRATSTTTPPADRSSTAGQPAAAGAGFGTGRAHLVTVTSGRGRVPGRLARLGGRGTRHLRLALVPPPTRPARSCGEAVRRLAPVAAAAHRARRAVRRRRARARARRRPGARRLPRPDLAGPRLHDRRDPRRRPSALLARLGRRALGHRPRVRHDRRAQARRARRSRSRPTAPTPTTGRPQAGVPSATTWRTTWSAATSPSTRWRSGCRRWSSSTRTAAWPTSPRAVLRTPARPEESFADDPLRMMRAARFASQLGFDVAPEVAGGDDRAGRPLSIVSAERIRDEFDQAAAGAPTRAPGWRCSSTPAWPTHPARAAGAASSRSTSTTATRTSTSTR